MPTESATSATPLARRLADRLDLDLVQLSGSGAQGRVTKADIEAVVSPRLAVVETAASALPHSTTSDRSQEPEFDLQPLNNVRRITARRLTEAKQTIPHFYLSTDCRVDALLGFRENLGRDAEGRFRISVNDLILQAVAFALRKVPEANASWTEEGIRQYHTVNLAVAVATERGLLTPVLRDAHTKGLHEIASGMRDLADRARAGKLRPEELQGGTCTVSNLGMYGIIQAVAVINPPQACILAFGKSERLPVARGDSSEIATLMNCTLSADHRVLDGAVAANFLSTLQRFLEEPLRMLL
ncbi:MAG: 2-oxo acid dehydrogenase subunit E2 [SAR324 cluster bacterium]|nr:2-oxo acid dehydrogenase subunit E2 [SAR324 cluster bacterium]